MTVATDADQQDRTTWEDLNAFQRDTLEAIARLERDDRKCHGLGIKAVLDRRYDDVHHGRLYPNLDSLQEAGLVAKGELDRRTNEYRLTDDARALLYQRVERLADACEMSLVATDGGER